MDSYAYDDNVIEFYIPEFDLNSKNFEKALTDKFKEVEFNKDNKVLKIVDVFSYHEGYSKAVLNNKYDENGNLSNTTIDRNFEINFCGDPVINRSNLEINHKDGLLLDAHSKTVLNGKESYLDYEVDYDEENNKSYINGTMRDSKKIEKLDTIECFYSNDNFSKPELYLTKDEDEI